MKFLTIGELSDLTRVNTVTLRAWERRHGLLKPVRSEKGHRLYPETDVQRVVRILGWIERGVSVGKVKALLESPGEGRLSDNEADNENHWLAPVKAILQSLQKPELEALSQLIQQGLLQYPPAVFEKNIFEPAVRKLIEDKLTGQMLRLQSALLGYSIQRLGSSRKTRKMKSILLIHGGGSPVWRLAIMALQLADLRWNVELMIPPCDDRSWLQLVQENPNRICVIYQDGRWSESFCREVSSSLARRSNLMLCGSAPILSGIRFEGRMVADPENLVQHLAQPV